MFYFQHFEISLSSYMHEKVASNLNAIGSNVNDKVPKKR